MSQQNPAQSNSNNSFCPSCGTQFTAPGQFCPSCGSARYAATPGHSGQPPLQPPPPQQPKQRPMPPPRPVPSAQLRMRAQSQARAKSSTSGLPWWGWLLIVLLAIVGVTVTLATNNNKQQNNPSLPPPSFSGAPELPGGPVLPPAGGVPGNSRPTVPNATPTQAASQPQVGAVGQALRQGDYQITVNTYQRTNSIIWSGVTLTPKAGQIYLAVDVTLESFSQRGIFAVTSNMSVKDAQGFKFSEIATGREPAFRNSSDLRAGEKIKGWVTFELPGNATGLVFEYRPTIVAGSDVVITVSLP